MKYWNDIDGTQLTREEVLAKLKTPGFHLALTIMPKHSGANVSSHKTRENYMVSYDIACDLMKTETFAFENQEDYFRIGARVTKYTLGTPTPQQMRDELLALMRPSLRKF